MQSDLKDGFMSQELEKKVAREAKAMTRREVIVKALAKKITWQQAADICGMTTRNMRRLEPWIAERDSNPQWPAHVHEVLVDLGKRLGHGV